MKKETFLSAADRVRAKRIEHEKFRLLHTGKIPSRYFLQPPTVKILMLVDTGISFNQFYFGLSEVIDTLDNNPEWWVRFEITRAHRQYDPNPPEAGTPAFDLYGPTYQTFRFNQAGFDMNAYDQLWIFSANSSTNFPQGLDDNELKIIYKWMNEKKGGVLAMGDHFNLGAALGSKIPRVRNMRKWTVADGVPEATGANRHDTLVRGHDFISDRSSRDESRQYTFDDESDDIPMRIRPTWYHVHHGIGTCIPDNFLWTYFAKRSPHPILCGRKGVINILPDHPHEGEVVVPADLTQRPNFVDYNFDEYPFDGSERLKPEIIARAVVQDDHKWSDFKGVVNEKEFGAIGVYNGHLVDVGRVVVDSTWHHWFDVNLTGRMDFNSDTPVDSDGPVSLDETRDPRKLHGFNDTPSGQADLSKIKNYYTNVAIWLSSPAQLARMAKVAMWNSLYRYPLYADLHPDMNAWLIGQQAIDVLGRYAGQCQVRSWWSYIFPDIKIQDLYNCDQLRVPVFVLDNLDQFMIGGILKSMLQYKDKFLENPEKFSDKELDSIADDGLKFAHEAISEYLEEKEKTEKFVSEKLNSFFKKRK